MSHRRRTSFPHSLAVLVAPVFLSGFLLMTSSISVAGPITSSGLGTTVPTTGTVLPSGKTQWNITGGTQRGANLFHSFGEFNVPTNNIANFQNTTGSAINNILGRVTGGTPSNIFGMLQTTDFGAANLWLINPAGVLFGPTASLNVGGSFTASTANYLRLADGARFNSTPGRADSILTSAAPEAFGFLGNHPASITVGELSVSRGKTIALVGGDITVHGQLSSRFGQVQIASVASKGEVIRETTPQGENLDVSSFARLGNVAIQGGGTSTGVTLIRGGKLVIDHGSFGPSSGLGVPTDSRSFDIAMRGDVVLQDTEINTLQGDTSISGKNITLNNSAIFAAATVIDITNPQGNSVTLHAANDLVVDSTSSIRLGHPHHRPADANIALEGARIVVDGFLTTAGFAATPGSVSLNATKSIDLTGTIRTRIPDTFFMKSGDVTLHAPVVRVTGGTINAGSGDLGAGNVAITGHRVTLTNANIDAPGRVGGGAGVITIHADKILVDNTDLNVSTTVDRGPGTIVLDAAKNLVVRNESTLTANHSSGSLFLGSAGTIHLEGGRKVVVQDSTISANSFDAHGGTIEIESPGIVRIENSMISVSTTGTNPAARGGTIEIATPRRVIIEGSELRANANAGQGGTINVTATRRVREDAASVISATSPTGPDGSVTITAPVTILNGIVEP